MFKSLLEIMKQLLGLAKDTQDNKDDIRAIQARIESVSDALQRVIFELQRLKENEEHERQIIQLRLENSLLRSERVLPAIEASGPDSLTEIQEHMVTLQVEIEELKSRTERVERLGKLRQKS